MKKDDITAILANDLNEYARYMTPELIPPVAELVALQITEFLGPDHAEVFLRCLFEKMLHGDDHASFRILEQAQYYRVHTDVSVGVSESLEKHLEFHLINIANNLDDGIDRNKIAVQRDATESKGLHNELLDFVVKVVALSLGGGWANGLANQLNRTDFFKGDIDESIALDRKLDCEEVITQSLLSAYGKLSNKVATFRKKYARSSSDNYAFKLSIQSTTFEEMLDPSDFQKLIEVVIINKDDNETVGYLNAVLLPVSETGWDHWTTFDGTELTSSFGCLYDENKEWFEDNDDALDFFILGREELLIIDEVYVGAEHRGKNLAVFALLEIVNLMMLHDARIALRPEPLQNELLEPLEDNQLHEIKNFGLDEFTTDEVVALSKLQSYLSKLGFRQAHEVDSSIWISDLSSMLPFIRTIQEVQ